MEAANRQRSDHRDQTTKAFGLGALLLALAFILLVGGAVVLAPVITDVHGPTHQYHAAVQRLRGDISAMPVGSGGAGAVEDEMKGFYAGRPLFKVPPSSPCRATKGMRC